ncbi:hypothetical protein HDV01_004569 [Terramyces sp. JEL0728]|nr:hypothetical protein HDV01_004569 [Terramyces sp. JEL0728]
MVNYTPSNIAGIAELIVGILNALAIVPYYLRNRITWIPLSECYHYQCDQHWREWNYISLRYVGTTFAIAEAIIDWIFMLRVYNLHKKPVIQYTWIGLFVCLDAIPRIVAIAMYQTTTSSTGLCLLSLPTTARIVKAALNTAFIGIVAIYFVYVMYGMISGAVGGIEVYESLTITSAGFGLVLCIVRTVIYIPYILSTFGPVYTGTLIPIEMCLLPPLCFFSIAFGAKLRVRGSSDKTGTKLSSGPSKTNGAQSELGSPTKNKEF